MSELDQSARHSNWSRNNGSDDENSGAPLLCFKPSLFPLNTLFRELIPFFGVECPVTLVYNYERFDEQVVRSKLGYLDESLLESDFRGRPLVVIG